MMLVVLMITLSAAMLEASLVSAKISLDRKLSVYLDVGLAQGTADYVQEVQQYVSSHGAASISAMPIPKELSPGNTAPICGSLSSSAMCSLSYVATVQPISSTAAVTGGPDPTNSLEKQFADEQKLSAVLVVSIVGPDGQNSLGQRMRELTLRVYDNGPFATLTGLRDIDTSEGTTSSAQGDSAGRNSTATDLSDTTIRSLEVCQHGALLGNPATQGIPTHHTPASENLPWGNDNNGAWEVVCDLPTQDISRFATQTWDTGTVNQSNWHL
jgi:hypothetical protein